MRACNVLIFNLNEGISPRVLSKLSVSFIVEIFLDLMAVFQIIVQFNCFDFISRDYFSQKPSAIANIVGQFYELVGVYQVLGIISFQSNKTQNNIQLLL